MGTAILRGNAMLRIISKLLLGQEHTDKPKREWDEIDEWAERMHGIRKRKPISDLDVPLGKPNFRPSGGRGSRMRGTYRGHDTFERRSR